MSEKFESWAVVELFGHQKIAGQVSEQQIAGLTMLRVDVPEAEGQAGWTRFYGGNAVYSITPMDEAMARQAVRMLQVCPITVYGMVVPERQIEARLMSEDDDLPGFVDDDIEYDEDDDPDWEGDDERE